MAAGWNLSHGDIKKYYVSEDELWAAFNYVFSDSCAKRTSYKFGLIKSILDNLLSVVTTQRGVEISYSNCRKINPDKEFDGIPALENVTSKLNEVI